MLGTASQGSSLIELALKLNPQEGQALFELIWAETIFSCCWGETQELLKVYLKDKVQKRELPALFGLNLFISAFFNKGSKGTVDLQRRLSFQMERLL